MKRILSLIGVVLVVGCGGPEPRDVSSLTILGDGVTNGFLRGTVVNPEDREPYSGPVFSSGLDLLSISQIIVNSLTMTDPYSEDPPSTWNGQFKNGLFNGPFEGYHDNGQLFYKFIFRDGVLDGPFEEYNDNGQLREKSTWKNGEKDQQYESYVYHDNGQLFRKGTVKDGEFDGPFEEYYDTGQLMEKSTWKNGGRDGPWEVYHENGRLWIKGRNKDGELDGPYESYDDNGQLRSKGIYKDDEYCGGWFDFGVTVTYDPC